MEKSVFIKDLQVKENITSVFMVKYIAVMEARDGKTYLNVVFSDKTGDIEARKWSEAEETVESIHKGDYVCVEGKVNFYQNRQQIIIKNIEKIDSSEIDESDFLASSDNHPEEMFNELTSIVEEVQDVYIKDLIKMILFDSEISRRIKRWSAAKTIHHAYQGGLLEHILSCTKLAMNLSRHYEVNSSYVIAGAILHDIGKIYELTDGPMIEYTEEGKLVGHIMKATEVIDRFASKIPNFPYKLKTHLKHIILSHHGELEFGAVQVPMTAEAMLVHYIDLLDSKLNALKQVKLNDPITGHWSGYVKHLDRMVFKGELPTYSEYEDISKSISSLKTKTSSKPKDKPLTHSLADQLKGFKPE